MSLKPSGEQIIAGFAAVAGPPHEIEEVPLSEVIQDLNERFGYDLSTSDQILIAQQVITLAEDEKMQQVALHNDIDKFAQVADPELDNIVARNHERNTTFVNRYFDDADFQDIVRSEARRRAYRLIQNPARTEALRQLRAQAQRNADCAESDDS
jgi:type I restriction enzyme R subunit